MSNGDCDLNSLTRRFVSRSHLKIGRKMVITIYGKDADGRLATPNASISLARLFNWPVYKQNFGYLIHVQPILTTPSKQHFYAAYREI